MVDAAFGTAVPTEIALSDQPSHLAQDSSLVSTRTQWVDLAAIAQRLNHHFGSQGITVQARWKESYLILLIESPMLPEVDTLLPQVQQALEALAMEAVKIVHVYARIRGETNPLWGRRITLAPTEGLQEPPPSLATPPSRTVADWLAQGSGRSAQILAPVVNESVEEQRFLRCCLGPEETVLIPLRDIQSIFTTHLAEIVPVPHMPDAVLGVHHYRGEMLWMVDLDAQLGLGMSNTTGQDERELTTLVLQHQNLAIGFVTHTQVEIETQTSDQIHGVDSALFPSHLVPYLSGYLQNSGAPVLNVSALLGRC